METECSADLTVNANIPERYVPAAEQRMDLYRRIAAIRTDEDASDLLDEMLDRYGEAPRAYWPCWTWHCCVRRPPRRACRTSPRRAAL